MNAAYRRCLAAVLACACALVLGGCAAMAYEATSQQVRLWGSSEVPPVTTRAYGTAVVNIATNRSVTVTLSTIGMAPTAAHIHEGAAGTNGPVILPLKRIAENAFVAADNATLTEAQHAAYKAGNLYINVHSVNHPNGEIRAQIAGR